MLNWAIHLIDRFAGIAEAETCRRQFVRDVFLAPPADWSSFDVPAYVRRCRSR